MLKKHKFFRFATRLKNAYENESDANNQDMVTRSELEQIFAFELRTANSHMSKLKVYSKEDRFSQSRQS